jgi:asparagine synthetase B (glutamine-hydrolysing)
MCGITILWGPTITKQRHAASMRTLQHRGPESSQQQILVNGVHVGFVRLHIQGTHHGGQQPFTTARGSTVVCNGEIYNAAILQRSLGLRIPSGASDCAVIPALLDRDLSLAGVARQLDGDFAIAVVDNDSIQVTRDPYGVRPLLFGRGEGWWGIVSEPIAWPSQPLEETAITPGMVLTISVSTGAVTSPIIWHQPPWLKIPYWRSSVEGLTAGGMALRHALEEAIVKRLVGLTKIAVWDDGSLGAALIAAVGKKRVHMITASTLSDAATTASEKGMRVILTGRGFRELLDVTGNDDLSYEGSVDALLCGIGNTAAADDITASARSVEVRMPCLDQQFIAVVRSLPTDALRMGLLRTAFEGVVDNEKLWSLK